MEISQVQAFLVLSRELHFGNAAIKLFVTQPALSRTIRNLEASLREQLFERSTRSVRLTNAGQAFVTPAKEFVDAHERAILSVGQAGSGQIGRVVIGFAGASSHQLIGSLVQAVRVKYPGVKLELSSSNFAQAGLSRVLDGSLDMALGRWGAVPRGLEVRNLVKETFVIAVPIWHTLATRTSVNAGELKYERFINLPDLPGAVLRDRLFGFSQKYGIDLSDEQIVPDTWTALALVGAGVGVALTLSTVRESVQFPGVVFVNIEDPVPPADLGIAWSSKVTNRAVESVLECVRESLPHE
ncbi:MAG: LysR family transcriptional regulator [Leucobacter sp.]